MANTLVSPGTSITVVDNSQYVQASAGSVPFILIATEENKTNQSNVVAPYTTSANAGQLFLLTSQYDLLQNFGTPYFPNVEGTPVNGSELAEYGLMTAYSTLGVSDAAYVMRADIDLSALEGSTTPPSGPAPNGTIWLDTAATSWGIQQWNSTSQTFSSILTTNTSGNGALFVITDPAQTSDDAHSVPSASIGKPSDYAVVTTNTNNPVWFQNSSGTWVQVGSTAWQASWPAAIGSVASPTANANLVLNGSNVVLDGNLTTIVAAINTAAITGVTAANVGSRLALYATSAAANSAVVVGGTAATAVGITAATYNAPAFVSASHINIPAWNSAATNPAPTGSVWFETTAVSGGANIDVQTYSSSSNVWTTSNVLVAANDASINYTLDPIGGGKNIPSGTFYLQYQPSGTANLATNFTMNLLQRVSGATVVTGNIASPTFAGSSSFTVQTSIPGSSAFQTPVTVSFTGNSASAFVTALNSASITGISGAVNSSNFITISNTNGGTFFLVDGTGTPLAAAGIKTGEISNWSIPTYIPSATAPDSDPANGTLWYFDSLTDFDIMINIGNAWAGYLTVTAGEEARGYNLTLTDPNGPQVSASAPLTQSTGNALSYGDLWINTSNMQDLPNINRWSNVSGSGQWIQITNSDHTSPNGVVFADARWANNGNTDPVTDPLVPITTLLSSNYLDPDAPSYALYPRGTLLFNTRRSCLNVKQFEVGYFSTYPDPPAVTNAWVTASGNDVDGVAYQGSAAQRNMVVKAMISAVENSQQLTDPNYSFNLIAAPGYPELMSTLCQLNDTNQDTAFVVGDSPMDLAADANTLNTWANNLNGATTDGEVGLVTANDYLAVYYPAGLTTDLGGNSIVMPASYMALPAILRSDSISFPWFAPAGAQRGIVNNATSLGYIDSASGNFIVNNVPLALRNVLFPAGVNPISNFPGQGILVYGDTTRAGSATAFDRINVSRLVAYLRVALAQIAATYVFDPNDEIIRLQIATEIGTLLNGLITNQGLLDYAVDCSTDNNTPATIDQNILNVSVAILPVKSIDFIYIPLTVDSSSTFGSSGSSVTAN